jgi:hypothetical protein
MRPGRDSKRNSYDTDRYRPARLIVTPDVF